MLKIYLDNCCFNRPYDHQEDAIIRLETEAKLIVQEKIEAQQIQLAWSYILDFENEMNPFPERRKEIKRWRKNSATFVIESEDILNKMHQFCKMGIKPIDALHVACAIHAGCSYFLTVDQGILKTRPRIQAITILNPIDFIYILEESHAVGH